MDGNNNHILNKNNIIDNLTPENVEDEILKLNIIDPDYDSEDEERDKIRLTNKGIDIRALKAGQDTEFEFDPDKEEDNYNWDDEIDQKIDYKKIFKLRNPDLVIAEDDNDENSENKSKTPFEVLRSKMIDISPDKDQGVLKRILIPGSGLVIPAGSRVRLHYSAFFEMNDEPFDSTHLRNKSFEFKLGARECVLGLDIGVATMKKHEKAQFIFEPDYYCGKFGCEPRVPRETPVLFEVEVISFVKANEYDIYEASSCEQKEGITLEQMLKICNCLRELGNDNYKRLNYKEASKKYRKSIYLLDNTSISTEAEEERWKGVMLKLYLNMSQVCLKQTKPKKTIYYCKLALDMDPQNAKAIYRYGKSLRLLQDFDRARKFLVKAYNIAPTNKDIVAEIKKLDEDVSKYRLLEKDIYKKMFRDTTNNKKETSPVSPKEDLIQNGVDDLNIEEKESLAKNQEHILQKLNEFVSNEKMKTFKVQLDMYSLEIINFIISQAESLNLSIRTIKGETNIMQIMKSD